MAKLTAPLFSFTARGQLAKALVYFPWKGINCVRQYVVPTNPRSDAQVTQRGIFEDGVDEFHGAIYSDLDKGAWNRMALILEKVMSGFNAMIKTFVNEKVLGNAWERIHHITFPLTQANNLDVRLEKAAGGNTPVVHYGTSKAWMPNSQAVGSEAGDFWRTTIAGLVKDTLYYFYFTVGASGTDYGRTGVYQQKTAAV